MLSGFLLVISGVRFPYLLKKSVVEAYNCALGVYKNTSAIELYASVV
ncbi:hypothetical protein SAMN05216323_10742 [Williamwhitmania taraxaci]|uniref:Uncharacterized protein n=1 Tax=Williamwhitmania taraxaci TaxID=1640674 RepID=A0A1G6RFC3_9BACT|nr:hypothetical protein SAMN05216323_10742 [Williamwhitmania taraxaci]